MRRTSCFETRWYIDSYHFVEVDQIFFLAFYGACMSWLKLMTGIRFLIFFSWEKRNLLTIGIGKNEELFLVSIYCSIYQLLYLIDLQLHRVVSWIIARWYSLRGCSITTVRLKFLDLTVLTEYGTALSHPLLSRQQPDVSISSSLKKIYSYHIFTTAASKRLTVTSTCHQS